MKKIYLVMVMAMLSLAGYAQDLSFNVKAGVNLSSYTGADASGAEYKPGARVGVGLEYAFNDMVSLQPSLFFSQKGAKYSYALSDLHIEELSKYVNANAKLTVNQLYLELPIDVLFRFEVAKNTNFTIATGPYVAYGVGGKTKVDVDASILGILSYQTKVTDFDTYSKWNIYGMSIQPMKRFDAGWNLELGMEFGQFLVGINSQFGFLKVCEIEPVNGMNITAPEIHNINFGLNVGYKF